MNRSCSHSASIEVWNSKTCSLRNNVAINLSPTNMKRVYLKLKIKKVYAHPDQEETLLYVTLQ